jgi:diguanylate cyclase (GGDEF)-like protein
MCDRDKFKSFNDNYGHLSGDYCLKQTAGVLKSAAARPGDLAARFGGEEFSILLPSTREATAFASIVR